jgi:hypothetical protein
MYATLLGHFCWHLMMYRENYINNFKIDVNIS